MFEGLDGAGKLEDGLGNLLPMMEAGIYIYIVNFFPFFLAQTAGIYFPHEVLFNIHFHPPPLPFSWHILFYKIYIPECRA